MGVREKTFSAVIKTRIPLRTGTDSLPVSPIPILLDCFFPATEQRSPNGLS